MTAPAPPPSAPDPYAKMSARQLAELLRREQAKRSTRTPSKAVMEENDGLKLDLERAHTREQALLSELAAARGDATSAALEGDRFAGKPALADIRRTWRDFTNAILRLPKVCREEGWSATRLLVAQEIIPSLYLFSLVGPRGPFEAREQDTIRRQFETVAFIALLSNDAPWADAHRARFLSRAARAYLRPTMWAVYEKASDASLNRDMLGTVFK